MRDADIWRRGAQTASSFIDSVTVGEGDKNEELGDKELSYQEMEWRDMGKNGSVWGMIYRPETSGCDVRREQVPYQLANIWWRKQEQERSEKELYQEMDWEETSKNS